MSKDMETTNGAPRHERRPRTAARTPAAPARTVEQLLEREQALALAGLSRNLGDLGAELAGAVGGSPVARHPALAGGAALLFGVLGGTTVLRGFGPILRLFGATAARTLPLAFGLTRGRFF